MSLSRTAKPTLGNLRRRLRAIHDAAESGKEMANRWNPKGRHFYAQRQLCQLFHQWERDSRKWLEALSR